MAQPLSLSLSSSLSLSPSSLHQPRSTKATGDLVAIKLIKRPLPKIILPNILREIRVRKERLKIGFFCSLPRSLSLSLSLERLLASLSSKRALAALAHSRSLSFCCDVIVASRSLLALKKRNRKAESPRGGEKEEERKTGHRFLFSLSRPLLPLITLSLSLRFFSSLPPQKKKKKKKKKKKTSRSRPT